MKKDKVFILDVVPSRGDKISTEILEDGKVSLGIPRFKSGWMNKYFMPKRVSPEIKVPLDQYGSEVWKLIDGNRTIENIILEVQEVFPEEHKLDERVLTYLYRLKHDKLVDFVAVK